MSSASTALDPEERLALVTLSCVPGIGPRSFRGLWDRFGSARAIVGASEDRLKDVPGIGPKLARAITTTRKDRDPAEEMARAEKAGVRIVARGEAGYPARLAEIEDPPPLLWIRGEIAPTDALAIAIVGSRHCSPYGSRIAEKLAASLARTGLTIVSGLARGIDAVAHRAALRAGGRTLAVLANGLGSMYPPEHGELADEVVGRGAILSESPMGQEPLPGLFPRRNRIISGICLGVVVVEATPRSGSLATARHANEQGREVFAVPGPVDSLSSRGCHALIRDGAKLVETAEDILEEIGPALGARPKPSPAAPEMPLFAASEARESSLQLSAEERKLLDVLSRDEPKAIDAIIAESGLGSSKVMAYLSMLEMRKLVKRGLGQRFTRVID